MTIHISFDDRAGAYCLQFPYEPGLVAALKNLPSTARRWDPNKKAWQVSPSALTQAQAIIGAYYPDARWPQGKMIQKAIVTQYFEIRYLGLAKERAPGEVTAMGLLANGSWDVIFPYEALTTWFEGGANQPVGRTLYSVLGCGAQSSSEEIKSAYRRMARQWHPDVCKEFNANEMFLRIKEAYEILADQDKRARYDAGLALEASLGAKPKSYSVDGYRAPLRCGMVLTEGTYEMGRFIASRILAWEDIIDTRGRVLVTSWPMGADKPVEVWA